MCEAFMMLPMMRWLKRNNFENLVAEYWDRSQPYHAFDVRADRDGDEYLFDLKFFRKRKFNASSVAKDIRHLSNPACKARYRYCVVSGAIECFLQDDDGVRGQFKSLVWSDDAGNAASLPLEIKIGRCQNYLTTVFRVEGTANS